MSTILKALRRVEEERPESPSARRAMRGDFVTEPDAAPPPPPRRKAREPNWKVWGSVGAALLLAALVWWRLPRPEPAPVAPERPARAEAPVARPPAPPAERLARQQPPVPAPAAPADAEPTPEPEPAAADAVPTQIAQQLPPLGETLEAPPPAPTQTEPAAEPVAADPAPVPRAAAPTPAPQAPAPSPPPPSEPVAAKPPPPAPAAKPAAPAPARPVAAVPAAPPPPFVLVERTSWHPKPERRIAWVKVEGLTDTRELHEGDAVGTLVVKEIRPSSVLFQHGSEPLTRRVGER